MSALIANIVHEMQNKPKGNHIGVTAEGMYWHTGIVLSMRRWTCTPTTSPVVDTMLILQRPINMYGGTTWFSMPELITFGKWCMKEE